MTDEMSYENGIACVLECVRQAKRAAAFLMRLSPLCVPAHQANSSSFKAIQAPSPRVYEKTITKRRLQKHKVLPENNLLNAKPKIQHSKFMRNPAKICEKYAILNAYISIHSNSARNSLNH
jgi:hypothetical protein